MTSSFCDAIIGLLIFGSSAISPVGGRKARRPSGSRSSNSVSKRCWKIEAITRPSGASKSANVS